jgi:stage V sporulation protein G
VEITEVRVFPVDEDKLKAFASIVIDDVFLISDIKIIDGKHGRFLSMPSTRRKNGTFRDIAHPLNNETRRLIEDKVFRRYEEVLAAERGAPSEVQPVLVTHISGGAARSPPDASPSLGF